MMTFAINTGAARLECDFIILFRSQGKSGRLSPSCNAEDLRLRPFDMIPTVSISVPLQTLPSPADGEPGQDSVPEPESRWSTTHLRDLWERDAWPDTCTWRMSDLGSVLAFNFWSHRVSILIFFPHFRGPNAAKPPSMSSETATEDAAFDLSQLVDVFWAAISHKSPSPAENNTPGMSNKCPTFVVSKMRPDGG